MLMSSAGESFNTDGTPLNTNSQLNTIAEYNDDDVLYLATEFAETYEDETIQEIQMAGNDVFQKVPNTAIYFWNADENRPN